VHFELTEQQRMIKNAAADFAAREIVPIAAERSFPSRRNSTNKNVSLPHRSR